MDTQAIPTPAILTARDIARMIDHSLLRPELTERQIVAECEVAQSHHVKTVCVRPCDVRLARRELAGSDVLVSVVVGFPHGAHTTAVKIFEAGQAMDDGSHELDVVLAIGKLKGGDDAYVADEIGALVAKAHARQNIVKVIFENYYLTPDEIVHACRLCETAGADFVKTSTGYAAGGATLDDVRLMRRSCSPKVGIKAAGGIRTLDQVLQYRAAGVSVIGTRSTVEILEEASRRERGGILVEVHA